MGVGISAHRLLQVRDCIVPNCIHEAENGSVRCRNHLDWKPGDDADASLLAALAAVTGEVVTVPLLDACKNGDGRPIKVRRGRYGGLCEECTDAAKKIKVSKPEPALSVPGVDGFEARAQRLVDAGRLVDETRRGLAAAQAQAAQIVEEANAAFEAAQDDWLRLVNEEARRPSE